MYQHLKIKVCVGVVFLLFASCLFAEEKESAVPTETITCQSKTGERQHCPANTGAGVILQKSTGSSACLLGMTWGYDDKGVWVTNGCSGEFLLAKTDTEQGAATPVVTAAQSKPDSKKPTPKAHETWGTLDPGKGFLIGRTDDGEVALSFYAMWRYMNQMGNDTFTDHLGREQPVDLRHDIYSHRILIFLKGWVAVPELTYQIAWWTVNTTDQDALFGNIGYQFHKSFNLYAGINGNPGSRSMQGSHPYWLAHDRVMADEFFRPFFTQGLWANGEVAPGLWYSIMAGNTSSTLGVTASQLDREFTYGGSMWWMPTTKEFGPRGAYGDWEMHQEVATRFGFSTVYSPEERYTDIGTNPGNTSVKLADSLNVFSSDALAPGVTVTNVDYRIFAIDAGVKYRGFFFQTEFYHRSLDKFEADGLLPVSEIVDMGFYIQTAFFPIPKKLELYVATSQIYGDSDAGFGDSSEYLLGMNFYPANTRNHRLNVQVIDVNKSPVSSTFGYYTGGQDGTTVSVSFSIFF